jgi:Ser/Thr protein kinase RdoA (MazF antagonist)
VSEAFDLREACRQYTGSPVVATSHLEHGQANVSHRVDLADGDSIVVRILKLTTPERARQEISIQHALVDAGITTPVSQAMKNGDVVGEIDGHAFTISHVIEGQHPQVVNEDLVTEFGRVLARFHNATQQLYIAGSSWLSEPTISQEGPAGPFDVVRRVSFIFPTPLESSDTGQPRISPSGSGKPTLAALFQMKINSLDPP